MKDEWQFNMRGHASNGELLPCDKCGTLTRFAVNTYAFCPKHIVEGLGEVVELEGLRVGAPQEFVDQAKVELLAEIRRVFSELQ